MGKDLSVKGKDQDRDLVVNDKNNDKDFYVGRTKINSVINVGYS